MHKCKISGVYRILNILNNKCYIGSSIHIYRRWGDHKWALKHNKHHSIYLQRAWNKYGEKHFKFEILETCEPIKDTILYLEQKYLDLNPEYNICKTANSTLGIKYSEESKQLISKKRRERINTYKHSEEIKHIISLANKGKIVSEETRNKFRKPIFMIDPNTDKIIKEFKSIGEAGIFMGKYGRRTEIKNAAQGKRNTAYGYKWRFKNK